mmetsp:Transcript_17506/g.35000  ORF Transcript_17506/g.35000 Transcript_17506/m.35000 type:complete len:592 (-) Transcript_17506:136-1911(-)
MPSTGNALLDSHLEELTADSTSLLAGCYAIHESGATAMADTLKAVNPTKLQEFGLYDNSIHDSGVTAIAGALKQINPRGLIHLKLHDLSMCDSGATAVADTLKAINTQELRLLLLHENKLKDKGVVAIMRALKAVDPPELQILALGMKPGEVNWSAVGLTIPPEALSGDDNFEGWKPVIPFMTDAEETGTPPAAAATTQDTPPAAAAAAQEQGGGEELRQLLRAQDLERLAEPLKEEGFERLEDLRGLGETDVEALCKEVLKLRFKDTLSFKKVLAQAKATATPPAAAAAAQATASPPAAAAADQEEVKFAARDLIMGDSEVSATGLQDLVGLANPKVLSSRLASGWDAIEEEWLSTGDENDAANYQYIRHGRGRNESDMPPLVKEQIQRGYYHGGSIAESDFDRGHDGWTLADFVAHEHARTAKLIDKEVFALRGYTSGSFPRFNKPLRLGLTPHPFKMTLYYLDEALRKLRAVEATKDRAAYMAVKELYRGMKDMNLDADKFQMYGGTEMACMSTTATKAVALKYASSTVPLLFRYKTRGNSRGVSIQFLSMFPGEDEYLYPPLTLLASDGPPVTEDGVTVFDVSPQFS